MSGLSPVGWGVCAMAVKTEVCMGMQKRGQSPWPWAAEGLGIASKEAMEYGPVGLSSTACAKGALPLLYIPTAHPGGQQRDQ